MSHAIGASRAPALRIAPERRRRSLLSLACLDTGEILDLIARGVRFAQEAGRVPPALAGKAIGIYFRKTSTRTRTSFAVAAARLGAVPICYGPSDLQTETGESLEDTALVLSGYLDALVVRSCGAADELAALAGHSSRMPVINAMSSCEHPTQALCDAITIQRHFGRLSVHMLYIGDGNNTAAALALLAGRLPGFRLTCATPPGYGLSDSVLQRAHVAGGGEVRQIHNLRTLPRDNIDVVYTTRWLTTGTARTDPAWKEAFRPFRVTADLMHRVSASPQTVFMHDLPAVRGEEVDADVIDGPSAIAFVQADHKLFGAMAVLEWCIGASQEDA
jgi:ornithine carbamoyltransferase